jgi:alpha-beta hydrolase superfamily lysophospholipase
MGSMAAQSMLLEHSGQYAGVVLSGSTALDLFAAELAKAEGPAGLEAFNAPFVHRTGYEWLSRDDAQVDAYVADERCGFGLDAEGGKAMFARARELADPDRLAGIRKDLPIHIMVGELDPVNGQLALVNALVERLQTAGLTDVTLTVWSDARHEIFNETNRDEVEADLLAWLDRVVPAR